MFCPCIKCCNSDNDSNSDDDEFDMMNEEQCDNMHDLIEESFPQEPNRDADKFYKLLDEAEQPLYPICKKYSNLAFIVKLIHLKCINGWSDKLCSVLLEFLKDVFPMCEKLPTRYYDAKKKLLKILDYIMKRLTRVNMIV
ncbi:hypothetical protein ACOSQ3_004392 [Xanthoceras sorbifolium]